MYYVKHIYLGYICKDGTHTFKRSKADIFTAGDAMIFIEEFIESVGGHNAPQAHYYSLETVNL